MPSGTPTISSSGSPTPPRSSPGAARPATSSSTLQGHAWLVVDLLEQGNPEAVDAQIEAFSEGADLLRQPLFLWQAAVWRAMRALLAGQLDRADELAAAALSAGSRGDLVTAPQYYAMQLLALRREQGRIGELEQPAREMIRRSPGIVAWNAALATLLLETGREAEARAEFEAVAANDFTDIPGDGDWLIAITLLADLSAGLGDARAGGDPLRAAGALPRRQRRDRAGRRVPRLRRPVPRPSRRGDGAPRRGGRALRAGAGRK